MNIRDSAKLFVLEVGDDIQNPKQFFFQKSISNFYLAAVRQFPQHPNFAVNLTDMEKHGILPKMTSPTLAITISKKEYATRYQSINDLNTFGNANAESTMSLNSKDSTKKLTIRDPIAFFP